MDFMCTFSILNTELIYTIPRVTAAHVNAHLAQSVQKKDCDPTPFSRDLALMIQDYPALSLAEILFNFRSAG